MNSSSTIQKIQADFDNLLQALTVRQHIAPREEVGQSLAHTVADLGVCPNAVQESLSRLQLDPQQSIGRLRRTELMQLARTVHRYWRQAVETSQSRG
jgi:hypothetical protein